MEIEVKGHSGCSIEIVREGRSLYVVKSTHDPKYVDRLHRQALKQQNAGLETFDFIRIPKIVEVLKQDEAMSMKMEYVYSKNFIDYFESADFEQIHSFANSITLFLRREIENSPMRVVGKKIIENKFNDVKNMISSKPHLNADSEISLIIKQSERVFSQLPNELVLPIGACHGDLTFSNILFNGNTYYLIDFLDSFIESPLMDMVKLRQDTQFQWSTLMYDLPYDETRFKIVASVLDKELEKYFLTFDWYKPYYEAFQLMNFLRILQYAREEKVIVYLKSIIKKLM